MPSFIWGFADSNLPTITPTLPVANASTNGFPPHEGQFASAFHPDPYWNPLALSFHLVNTIRKTGKPYDSAAYTERMVDRARKWGFNSAGAFGAGDAGVRRAANFPHVAHLPLAPWEGFPDVPGTHGAFDPFNDKLREHCDEIFAQAASRPAPTTRC